MSDIYKTDGGFNDYIKSLLGRYNVSSNPQGVKFINVIEDKFSQSSIGLFVEQLRGQVLNSSIKNTVLSNIFQDEPDVFNDEVVSDTVQVDANDPDYRTEKASTNLFTNFLEWFNKVTTEEGVDTKDVAITLTDGSAISIIKTSENSFGTEWTDGEGIEHVQDFMVRTSNDTEVDNLIRDTEGNLHALPDVIIEVDKNAEINDYLIGVLDACVGDVKEEASMVGAINNYVESKWECVKKVGRRLLAAWSTGGLYGLICAIVDIFKGPASATVGDNGLVFTNNSLLCPLEFSTGILSNVGKTLSGIATAVVAIFSPIVAIVGSILGSLVHAIVAAPNYDYQTATVASMVDDVKVGAPIAPYGLFPYSWTNTDDSFPTRIVECRDSGLWCKAVPGGVVLYTYYNNELRQEFHPDLIDRRYWRDHTQAFTRGQVTIDSKDYEVLQWGIDLSSVMVAELEDMSDQFSAFMPANNDLGVLDAVDDATLSEIVGLNIIIYAIYSRMLETGGYILTEISGADTLTYFWRTNPYLWDGQVVTNESAVKRFRCGSVISGVPHITSQGDINHGILELFTMIGENFQLNKSSWMLLGYFSTASEVLASMCSGVTGTKVFSDEVSNSDYAGSPYTWEMYSYLSCALTPQGMETVTPFMGGIWECAPNKLWAFKTPKYNRANYWASFAMFTVSSVIVAAVATFGVVAARLKLKRKQSMAHAQAEHDWTAYCNNPSAETLNTYKKSVRKNNFLATLTGGDKINKFNYWGSSESSGDVTNVTSAVSQQMSATETQLDGSQSSSVDSVLSLIRGFSV